MYEIDALLLIIGFLAVGQDKRETLGVLSGRIIEPFVSHVWKHHDGWRLTEMPSDGDRSII